MSLGFTCPKSEGNYGNWYQWSENKCRDTSVRITLVWVTGDTHPNYSPVGIHCIIFSLFSDAWESCADRNKNLWIRWIRWNGKPFQSLERFLNIKKVYKIPQYCQRTSEFRDAGIRGATLPPISGRSFNPILTWEEQIKVSLHTKKME